MGSDLIGCDSRARNGTSSGGGESTVELTLVSCRSNRGEAYLSSTNVHSPSTVPTSRPWVGWNPSFLQSQLIVPEWTRGVSKFSRISNLPSPEEPILKSIHICLTIRVEPILVLLIPVEPFLVLLAATLTLNFIRWDRVDSVQPFTAVVGC